MTVKVFDRLFETTASIGTGDIVLLGAQSGFQSFAKAGDGGKVFYQINDGDSSGVVQNWEIGIGTVHIGSPNTMSRTTVLSSSNNDAAVSFGAGTKNVIGTIPAAGLVTRDENLNLVDFAGVDDGAANAHAVTLNPAPTGYSDMMMLVYRIKVTNTNAAVTVNVNGLGTKSLKINGANPTVGQLQAGTLLVAFYKALNNTFEIISIRPKVDLTTDVTGILPAANLPATSIVFNAITGFLPSAIGASTVTFSAGQASDSTNAAYITKSTATNWAASNGNAINGFDGGATLPNSATIYFFICQGTSGHGVFASTSKTPTFPAGYDTYTRRIFSLFTNSSGALVPGVAKETEGGSVTFYLTTPVNDVNGTIGTTRQGVTVSVPAGHEHELIARTWQPSTAVATVAWFSPDETDIAPTVAGTSGGIGYETGGNAAFAAHGGSPRVITNTSRQISVRASASTTANLTTRGWKDFRRS